MAGPGLLLFGFLVDCFLPMEIVLFYRVGDFHFRLKPVIQSGSVFIAAA
jgi:hypothetical protein